MCKQSLSLWYPTNYVDWWKLREYEPSVQLVRMRFRRLAVARKPIQIQAIRCGSNSAIIGTGDGYSGYILKEDEKNEDRNITMFNIYGKFKYKCELPHSVI